MTTGVSHKTNKHPKNKSIEERLERAVGTLESMIENFNPEDDDYIYMFPNGVTDAKNLDDIYKQVCNCIQMLEHFRTWLDHQATN
jgi:hypothetical protein